MDVKDTFFWKKRTLNCDGEILLLDEPLVMGILNVTNDSFFDGGKYTDEPHVVARATQILEEGGTIIDVGGASSRPGATPVPQEEELARVIPAIKAIKKEFPASIISIDTYRSEVARQAAGAGAAIINDIAAGCLDKKMFNTVAELQLPYIMMHMQGEPGTMQHQPQYKDVVLEVFDYFYERIQQLQTAGVNDIIIDPGFGFGKTLEHNYSLLNAVGEMQQFGCPVLVGFSRKSMINQLLGTTPAQALNGTTVLNTMALQKGANILRVHDVKEAVEAVKIYTFAANNS